MINSEFLTNYHSAIVHYNKQRRAALELVGDVEFCGIIDKIHVFKGLEKLATMFGIIFDTEPFNCETSELYMSSFAINGVEYFQIGKTEEESFK